MLKLFSILSHIVAGTLIYVLCFLVFMGGIVSLGKAIIVLVVFLVPAMIALICGLALTGFRGWRRDVGMVVMSAASLSGFIEITLVCMLLSDAAPLVDDVGRLLSSDGYLPGAILVVALAGFGWLLLKSDKNRAAISS
nr:hypothetical protein [uncultured Duganella sp.]